MLGLSVLVFGSFLLVWSFYIKNSKENKLGIVLVGLGNYVIN